MGDLKITQVRSAIGRKPAQRKTLRALGLNKIGNTVIRKDTPETRGMVFTIKHLVEVMDAAPAAPSQKDAAPAAPSKDAAPAAPSTDAAPAAPAKEEGL